MKTDGSSGAAVGFTIFFVAIVAFIIYAAKNNRYKGGFGGGVYHGATYHSACAWRQFLRVRLCVRLRRPAEGPAVLLRIFTVRE